MHFDRFDICEAWCVLAHDYGLYGIFDRIRQMGLRPSPTLRYHSLTFNGKEIYHANEAKASRMAEMDVWMTSIIPDEDV